MTRKLPAKASALRLFVCFSGNASAIRDLENDDPDWNHRYEVVGSLTDVDDVPGMLFFKKENIPCHYIDRSIYPPPEVCMSKRDRYFDEIKDVIDYYAPDYIVFSGFMLIAPPWFVRSFERKIINVHPTDLSRIDANGKRKYAGRGDVAIQKVLDDGMTTIRSTVHFVEEGGVDEGEIIAHSRPCTISPKDTAQTLQERLKLIADGDALKNALKTLYSERVAPIQ